MNYAIILAAGKGTRMKSDIPKCGISLLGKPMICYLTENLKNTSVDEIVCVVGYKKEFFFNTLKDSVSYRIQKEQLGSGHAVACCKDIDKNGYTVIVNGDTPLVDYSTVQRLINHHLKQENVLTVLTMLTENPTGYGRIIRNNGRIAEIREEGDLTEEQKNVHEVNSGVMCVQTNFLFQALEKISVENSQREYYLTDIVKELSNLKIGALTAEDTKGLIGINDLYQLSVAEEQLRMDIIQKHLQNGVRITDIPSVVIGSDVIIEAGAYIQGSTVLGNSIIHRGCHIMQCFIQDGIVFDDSTAIYSVIKSSIVGKDCTIGPFAHVRAGSVISGKNRVGNYVEIKNSKVGKDTKISHLAYMGDCLCGENVNFGCGSITVNYDGINKNKTVIGDNVFIGCNSNLIAPISIDSDSFIAAGSTITENVDCEDFAIARSRQTTKKGYASKYKKDD